MTVLTARRSTVSNADTAVRAIFPTSARPQQAATMTPLTLILIARTSYYALSFAHSEKIVVVTITAYIAIIFAIKTFLTI